MICRLYAVYTKKRGIHKLSGARKGQRTVDPSIWRVVVFSFDSNGISGWVSIHDVWVTWLSIHNHSERSLQCTNPCSIIFKRATRIVARWWQICGLPWDQDSRMSSDSFGVYVYPWQRLSTWIKKSMFHNKVHKYDRPIILKEAWFRHCMLKSPAYCLSFVTYLVMNSYKVPRKQLHFRNIIEIHSGIKPTHCSLSTRFLPFLKERAIGVSSSHIQDA